MTAGRLTAQITRALGSTQNSTTLSVTKVAEKQIKEKLEEQRLKEEEEADRDD